jgi:hypothetical protein
VNQADLLLLRVPLAVLAAVLALGGLGVWQARERLLAAQAVERAAAAELESARRLYLQSDRERAELERYLPQFRALENRGFVGAEPRLAWIELIRAASAAAQLPGIDYDLGTQQPLALAAVPEARLARSALRVTLHLLHEEDLLRFLRHVEERRPGYYALSGCTLVRLGAPAAPPLPQPNLQAECELVLVSWPGPGAKERKP